MSASRRAPLTRTLPLLAAALLLAGLAWLQRPGPEQVVPPPAPAAASAQAVPTTLPAFLPAEAGPVVASIRQGGPFPHRQDGSVFENRERRRPQRARGLERE